MKSLLPQFIRHLLAESHYLRRLVRNAGWVLAERVLRYAVGFLVGVWIARYVGPEQYGLLNYALAYVTVLAFLGTLGLDSLVVRELVRDPSTRDEMLGTLLAMRLIGGLLLILSVAAMLVIVRPPDDRALALIALVSLAVVIQAFESIDCWFQSLLASRFTVIAKSVALLSATLVRIALILIHAPLVAFAWAILVEATVLAAGMLFVYARSGASTGAMHPSLFRAKALLTEGWPLVLTAAMAALSLRIDQVMLGQMADFGDVGAYAVATRIVEVSYIVPVVVMASVFPAMIKMKDGEPAIYDARIQALFDLLIWLAIAIAIPTWLLAPLIVDFLVSEDYVDAVPVLAVLAWMPILVFFAMARQRWLIAEGQLRIALLVEVVGCILNILCNLWLIPRYGAVGAAYAAILAAAGSSLVLVPFVRSIRQSVHRFLVATTAPLRLLNAYLTHS